MNKARRRLVQIDEPKSGIEQADVKFSSGPKHEQTQHAETDVKNVVRRGSAGETVLCRNDEPRDANQD